MNNSFEIDTKLSPPQVFKNKENLTISAIDAEPNDIFFFDRYEYPEEGGILMYKYGGTIVQNEGEPHKYFCTPEELKELGQKEWESGYIPKNYKVPLCGSCNKCEVTFVPKAEIKNRVDLLYPEKGFVEPQIIELINPVKSLLIEQIRFFASISPFLLPILFLPFKIKVSIIERWIKAFARPSVKWMHSCYLEKKYYSNISRELFDIIQKFLINIGIRSDPATDFAEILVTTIEFDSAYRYRSEDLFSCTTKELLMENPRRELKKILQILAERDERIDLNKKYRAIGTVLSLLLLHPRIKRAFKEAIKDSKFENLQLDKADSYHVLRLGSYKFMGRTYEDRVEEYKKLHNGNWPEPIPVTVKAL